MTGFGQATGKVGKGKVYVELKTINHRYAEYSLRLPSRMNSLESKVRDFLKKRFERGKCDLFIRELEPIFGGGEIRVDLELAKKYQQAVRQLQKKLQIPISNDILALAGLDRFLGVEESRSDYTKVWGSLVKVLTAAWRHLEKMRQTEGVFLLKDQRQRLHKLGKALRKIERLALSDWENRKEEMVPMMGVQGTAAPIPTKMDISEEVTRLVSHMKQYQKLLGRKDPMGRKIDFLIQEMHRELNTIGAKAQNAEIALHVVEGKAELEKLREQIQNVE